MKVAVSSMSGLRALGTGTSYYDEWNRRPITPRRAGDDHVIDLEIGPMDVGCLVIRGYRTDPPAKRPPE